MPARRHDFLAPLVWQYKSQGFIRVYQDPLDMNILT
jgi:GH25 family lysozyme M1 (1,4-beta-N-acetylmuramidase)